MEASESGLDASALGVSPIEEAENYFRQAIELVEEGKANVGSGKKWRELQDMFASSYLGLARCLQAKLCPVSSFSNGGSDSSELKRVLQIAIKYAPKSVDAYRQLGELMERQMDGCAEALQLLVSFPFCDAGSDVVDFEENIPSVVK